jgi:putative SOS response-associated peptidase YedK
MSWGFVLLQPGKAPRRVTNVRDDKILTSRFWTPSFQQRRCLVPASSYCEPESGKRTSALDPLRPFSSAAFQHHGFQNEFADPKIENTVLHDGRTL